MIFKLTCVKYFFSKEDKEKYEKMGFSFEKCQPDELEYEYNIDHSKDPTMIFHSIENLKEWSSIFCAGQEFIISFDPDEICIYDDYVE